MKTAKFVNYINHNIIITLNLGEKLKSNSMVVAIDWLQYTRNSDKNSFK